MTAFKMPPLDDWPFGYRKAIADRDRAVLEAVAEWLRNPEGAAHNMDGWAIEQRMAGAMLLVNVSNELRAAARTTSTR